MEGKREEIKRRRGWLALYEAKRGGNDGQEGHRRGDSDRDNIVSVYSRCTWRERGVERDDGVRERSKYSLACTSRLQSVVCTGLFLPTS